MQAHNFLDLVDELLVMVEYPPDSLKPRLLGINEACVSKRVRRRILELLGKALGKDLMTIFCHFVKPGFDL